MKNKLLSIAIASALATLWSGNLLAAGNSIDVTQTDSQGSVTGAQQESFVMTPKMIDSGEDDEDGNPIMVQEKDAGGKLLYDKTTVGVTSNSTIKIIQEGADATSSVGVTQAGTTNANAEVKQYNATGSTVTINQSGATGEAGGNIAKVLQGTQTTKGTGAVDGAGSNNQNHLTINTQAGSGNKIIGYAPTSTDVLDATGKPVMLDPKGTPDDETDDVKQVGPIYSGTNGNYATQSGAGNNATLNQNGTINVMGFNQKGAGNQAVMTQDTASTLSKMNVSQDGTDNKVTATQSGTSNSDMNIKISGGSRTDTTTDDEGTEHETVYGGHEVTANQSSDNSTMMVSVTGADNTATLEQSSGASDSNMLLTQNGDLNDATMRQHGADNDMSLDQQNHHNTATLTQNGSGDTMAVSQTGNSIVTMTQ